MFLYFLLYVLPGFIGGCFIVFNIAREELDFDCLDSCEVLLMLVGMLFFLFFSLLLGPVILIAGLVIHFKLIQKIGKFLFKEDYD